MPNVKLKDGSGNEIVYEGVTTLTVPDADGENIVSFVYQQSPSLMRLYIQEFLDGPDTKYKVPFKDGILLSSNILGFGLWYVTEYEAIKIYNLGDSWQYFFNTPVGCLCSNNQSNDGLLLVDLEMLAVTKLMSGYGWQMFYETEFGCLVYNNNGGTNGIKYFQYASKTIITVYAGYAYYYWAYKTPLGWLISAQSSSGAGVWLFNESTLIATRIYILSYNWRYFIPVSTGCFIGSSQSSSGLLYFNYSTGTISQVYASGYSWNSGIELITGSLALIGGAGTGAGLIRVDLSTLVITSVSTAVSTYAFQAVLGGCITGGGSLYYYDIAADTYTVVKAGSSGSWNYFQPVEGGCLCSNTYQNLNFFDEVTKTVTIVYSAGTAYSTFKLVTGGCLCSSIAGGSSIILFYSYATRTITTSYGLRMDTFMMFWEAVYAPTTAEEYCFLTQLRNFFP